MVSFNWTWADYERCKREEERKAAKRAAKAEAEKVARHDAAAAAVTARIAGNSRPVPAAVPAPVPEPAASTTETVVADAAPVETKTRIAPAPREHVEQLQSCSACGKRRMAPCTYGGCPIL